MKKLLTALLFTTAPLYATPQWILPPTSIHINLYTLPSCWISKYCNKQNNQPIINQIEDQLVRNNNVTTNQEVKQKTNTNKETKQKTKNVAHQQPLQPPQSQAATNKTPLSAQTPVPPQQTPAQPQTPPTISKTHSSSHNSHKLFTNTVYMSITPDHRAWYNNQSNWLGNSNLWYNAPPLIKDINYLYKMGYLPFHVINYTQIGDDYKVTYQWDAKHVPHKLVQLSITNPHSILYRSAILRFMRDYGTHFNPSDTQYASVVLKQAYDTGFTAEKPFVWVYVDQHIPQKVYVWQKGKYIFKSPANTGVMYTTAVGNFMIYLRFRSTVMEGTLPGTDIHYYDPDVPWVNYFHGGEAIHGFPRRYYGYPQSAGCVELPIYKAKELYPILYKYAVVTVSRE